MHHPHSPALHLDLEDRCALLQVQGATQGIASILYGHGGPFGKGGEGIVKNSYKILKPCHTIRFN